MSENHPIKSTLIIVATLLIVGCGGGSSSINQPASNSPQQAVSFAAGEVFSPKAGEVHKFRNGYGDITTISYEATPDPVACQSGNNIDMHFTKQAKRSYWEPSVEGAELHFILHQNPDGSWRSTASLIVFPFGCPWCTPDPFAPVSITFNIADAPKGEALPYLIVPGALSSSQTLKNPSHVDGWALNGKQTLDCIIKPVDPSNQGTDSGQPGETWETDFYVENVSTPVYSGPAAVSEQREGKCVHEKWYFVPKLGLVKIIPLDLGSCSPADSLLAIERIP